VGNPRLPSKAILTPLDVQVTLLVGDVSFLHDTNGLLLVNNRPGQPPVVTVVVNNSGGGIFSLLPNVDTIPGSHFTQYWSTPHDVFLDRLCSGHRWGVANIFCVGPLDLVLIGVVNK
jgi:2-succinyl-5-enolpyruvyl-6-hydroxy-3-cyclohexene-1-carboxylate synthase